MAFPQLQFNAPNIKSPFEIEQGYQQIQQGQNQNKLAQMQFKEAARVDAERNALTQAAQQYGNTPEYGNELLKRGLVKPYQDHMKFQADQQKAARDTEKANIESHLQKFDVIGQIMGGVRDEQSWQSAKQQIAQVLGPESVSAMPQNYDPAVIEENRNKAMTVKQQLEQKWKELEYTTPTANARLSADTSVANARLSADTSRANNAASLGVTLRGQDMTDARGRDLNATRVEENNIKRESKANDVNLAKSGQVASFDTMLGTLERLSKHPGLSRSVGPASLLNPLTVPGSESANFLAELNTFQSQAFVPMVAQLKGMGALSDAEGKKLTQAVGALSPSMSKQAFKDSVTRIMTEMNIARERVAGKAKPASTPAPQAAIDLLRKNPALGPKFKEKYGYLP